jgi:hypothetical protein
MAGNVKVKFDRKKIAQRAQEGIYRNLNHAAASIRITARGSIKKRKNKSAVGDPPNTRQGALKRAIIYAVSKKENKAWIGVSASLFSTAAQPHELGGEFRGRTYKKRPFMVPALKKRVPDLLAGMRRILD